MLQGVSWKEFGAYAALVSAGYYLYIGVRYYRTDVLRWSIGGVQPPVKENSQPDPASETDKQLPLVQGLVDEVEAFLQSGGKGLTKETLLARLPLILQKYAALQGAPFQPSINQLIAQQSEHLCGITLTEEEVSYLWNI